MLAHRPHDIGDGVSGRGGEDLARHRLAHGVHLDVDASAMVAGALRVPCAFLLVTSGFVELMMPNHLQGSDQTLQRPLLGSAGVRAAALAAARTACAISKRPPGLESDQA